MVAFGCVLLDTSWRHGLPGDLMGSDRSPRPISELANALSTPALLRTLSGRRLAIFLDYDGTLTPIVDRPGDAVISEEMRSVVERLSRRVPLAIVSGRERRVVQALMRLSNLVVAGSHGFEIWSPEKGDLRTATAQVDALVAEVAREARQLSTGISGVVVEDKPASVGLHYRLVAPAERSRIATLVDELCTRHEGQLKVTPGKMVFEIQPDLDWNKGRAVRFLVEDLARENGLPLSPTDVDPGTTSPPREASGESVLALYIGDDITDEDVFVEIQRDGVGIVVTDDSDRARLTSASYSLDGVEEVRRFLELVAAELRPQPNALAVERSAAPDRGSAGTPL
jgi:trehalose 6-phosphate phosphatase